MSEKRRLGARSHGGRTRLYARSGLPSISRAALRCFAHSNAALCMPNFR
jgi:hypothetical protein